LTAASPGIREGKVRVAQFIAVTWLTLVCVVAPACAEKRVALVVGNDAYVNLPQLQKAVNDARAVGGALTEIGFEVITGENLGRGALLEKLNDLIQRLAPGDTAFFFFSGHGVAVDGVSYIMPSDLPDVYQETRLKLAALSETDIVAGLTGRGVRVAVVVLDAARVSPFSRSVGGGSPPPRAAGVFSLYATSSDGVAYDQLYDGDPNPNSVFTRVLVPALKKPGVDLQALALEVRTEVERIARAAGHVQQPAYYDETIGGRVYLAGLPPAGPQPLAREPSASEAAQAWAAVQNSTSFAALDEFIRQYGNVPVYGALARERREELARKPAIATAPQLPPAKPAAVQPSSRPTKRALVIGINAYPNLGAADQLERAVADAEAVGDKLRSLGFQVTRLTTAPQTTLDAIIHGFEAFRKTVGPNDMVMLFYAGHGVGLSDGTYLVPGDVREASLEVGASAKRAAINENELTDGLRQAAPNGIIVAVIDACRNNLLSRGTRRALGERGLRPVETEGIFKLYSASEGQTALDRLPGSDGSRNSVFTRVFLKAIGTPGLNLNTLGATVRDEVHVLARSGDHEQTPAVYDKLIGSTRVYLAGETAAADAARGK
jgi:uncharacterized caspase-like protein